MNRCTNLTLVLALTLTCGCSSNSLFGKRGRMDLDSTYADSTATAKYPDRDTTASVENRGILAAANYQSAAKLIEQATKIAESASSNDKGKLIESRSLFQRALKQKPDDPTIHHQLAILSDKLQDYEDAQYHYLAAIQKSPKKPDLLSDLGYSYFLQKNYDKAEETLTRVLESNPDHKHAAVNLGAVHGALGNHDEAMSWFRRGGSEAEAQRNLAEFFPNGPGPAANIASRSNAGNPFEGPAELQPERLIPESRVPNQVVAQAPSGFDQLPQINAGTSTAPNLQAAGPARSNPFESGFAATAPQQPQTNQFQQQTPQQPVQYNSVPQQQNPFDNGNQFVNNVNQAASTVQRSAQDANRVVQQVGYEQQQTGLPQWPHSPSQQPANYPAQNQTPTQSAPAMAITPARTVSSNANQLPIINPGQSASTRGTIPNVLHQAQQLGNTVTGGIQQTSAQFDRTPQVERNAQFAGMNAGPGQMFPVQDIKQQQNFAAQVNQLQQNARTMIPQPAQNQIRQATAGMHQQVNSTINTISQQGATALNQIPQAQYPDVNATADNMRNTLGNIVDQYQQQGSQLQQQSGQQLQQYGNQINNAVQQSNPFTDQQLPQIFPGNSGR